MLENHYVAVTPFPKKLNWLTVENMLSVAPACFMYKAANDVMPGTVARMFLRVNEVRERTTRQSNDLHVPMALTPPGRRSLTYRGPRLWNSLPDDMKESPSLHKFKESLPPTSAEVQCVLDHLRLNAHNAQ